MKYTEAGTYTLIYKATDKCGNETEKERTVYVYEKKTVLFEDGTFIINELSKDRGLNNSKYGAVVSEYSPLDANNDYVFSSGNDQPWFNERSQITNAKFGSPVVPIEMAYWFQNCNNLTSIDWTNCDPSNVTTIRAMFASTSVTSVTFPSMPHLTNIRYVFNRCTSLTSVDFSNVGATSITNTGDMFQGCTALTEVDLRGLAGTVESCERMFANANSDENMAIHKIFVSASNPNALDFQQATSSANMFRNCVDIEGGEGTQFNSSFIGNQYARIDNPPDAPGYFTAKA